MAPEHAFDRLYRRHARDVYRFAYGLVRNQADAEDVVQTAFLNAYRALARGHRPESPRNWLLAIARNVYRQRLRGSQRRPQEVALDVELAEAIAVEEDSALDPSDIGRALDHLSANQRAALVLREVEGRSYAEIATALGVSGSAVETLIFRGRRALREQLEATLTCADAERLIATGGRSRQLRAHLRECAACSSAARSARARRSALRSLFGLPWLGGGSAAVATKVATVVLATGVAGGLTQLLRPAEQPRHATRPPHLAATMPIAAAVAVPGTEPRHRPHRPAAVRRPDAHAIETPAAPIRSTAHPDAAPAPAVEQPVAPPVTTAPRPQAAAPAAPSAPAPTTTGATTTVATTATASTTVAVTTPALPVVPPVTVTVTLPGLPPPPAPDLTQTSQNSGARNSGLGHLIP